MFITLFLVVLALISLFASSLGKKSRRGGGSNSMGDLPAPPSPFKLPILGHLHLLGRHQVPYEDFTSLAKKYGDIYALQLGCFKCVVVNGQKNIREAMVTKGHHFDSRPNFQRYHQLFSGNKENSLAFCNWSTEHKTRRDMLKSHTFPKSFTNNFANLEHLITSNISTFLSSISDENKPIPVKPLILQTCANIFLEHFCSKSFPTSNKSFLEMIDNYDEIFYEVNQGYAADFLPFLLQTFHGKNLKRLDDFTHKIRKFVLEEIIEERFEEFCVEEESPKDYVESLVKHVKGREMPEMSWDVALFALEDIIGGHSAVGNFLVKVLAFLAKEKKVQEKIQQEIEEVVGERCVTISDRSVLPYTEAAILEAVRLIASPIVPRAANQTSSIGKFRIEKDTLIFLNNHQLNMCDELWHEPQEFKPERFIKNGRLAKPDHFLPFGGGRRSCMGYKMVQLISFALVSNLLQKFTIHPENSDRELSIPVGSLALPKDTFQFSFARR